MVFAIDNKIIKIILLPIIQVFRRQGQGQRDCCKFEVSLVYAESSRLERTLHGDTIVQNWQQLALVPHISSIY